METHISQAVCDTLRSRVLRGVLCPHEGFLFSFFFFRFSTHIYFPASGQAVVTGVVPFSPPVLAFILYRA